MPALENVPLIECETSFHTWTEKENTKQSDSENTFEHSGLIKVGDVDKPVMHGIVRTVIAGGGLFESQYNNGQEHGFSRFIQPDGSYWIGNYNQGAQFGVWRHYDSSNKLLVEQTY